MFCTSWNWSPEVGPNNWGWPCKKGKCVRYWIKKTTKKNAVQNKADKQLNRSFKSSGVLYNYNITNLWLSGRLSVPVSVDTNTTKVYQYRLIQEPFLFVTSISRYFQHCSSISRYGNIICVPILDCFLGVSIDRYWSIFWISVSVDIGRYLCTIIVQNS